MDNGGLLETFLGPDYIYDLADTDSICGLMSLQGEAISESVTAIESVLVTGQPGRADVLETQAIATKRGNQPRNF